MSFLELWEAMHCIEPAITAAAALRISDAELDLLEENVDRTRHAAAHSQDLVALDLEFHTIIAGTDANQRQAGYEGGDRIGAGSGRRTNSQF